MILLSTLTRKKAKVKMNKGKQNEKLINALALEYNELVVVIF